MEVRGSNVLSRLVHAVDAKNGAVRGQRPHGALYFWGVTSAKLLFWGKFKTAGSVSGAAYFDHGQVELAKALRPRKAWKMYDPMQNLPATKAARATSRNASKT